MKRSKRGFLLQLASSRLQRESARALQAAPAWLVAVAPRRQCVWQRATALLVAVCSFFGPVSITFEQGCDAAGVLAAGSRRVDDDAWQTLRELAALRIRFAMQTAQATPIVDPAAPISFRPRITQSTGAGGGVPVVNITAPNAAGISLNQYQSFNIDPVGLILNNSLAAGTSLTGGNVGANPNLNGRTASVIVNQVTSTGTAFASLLNGPLEVFGAPATVIIANPNGITTRGAGFTNTIGVTLSTGTPQFLSGVGGSPVGFDNAQAIGYDVRGGHIQIEGNAGVNGPGAGIEGTVGTIDLIGATIGVNAPLYAGTRINAIAGQQFVSPTAVDGTGTTYGTASNGAANTAAAINAANGNANGGLAIDATAYGAMTAGQIQMIGTAAGMGVRTDGQLAANVGDLTLSANGDVTMAGTAAQQQARIQSSGNVTLTGAHIGIGGYSIGANGDVVASGTIQSNGNVAVTAGGNLNVANAQAGGDLSLTAGSNATAGDLQSGANLSIGAHGRDGAGDVTLGGTTVVTGATQLQAARDIAINGHTSSGSLQASAQRNVNVNAPVQTSGDVALSATSGDLTLASNVNSGAGLQLQSGNATTISAQTTALDAVTVSAGQGVSVTGSLTSGTTLAASTAGAFSVAGSLLVGTDLTLNAGSIDVSGVLIAQQDGVVNAHGDITGSGSIAFGQNGALSAAQDVSLTGKLLANGLQINAARSVSLADVQAGGAFSVAASGGDVTFNGNAAAVGTTSVQAARDVRVDGTLAGGASVSLWAQRNVAVASSGTVQSVGDLSLDAVGGNVSSGGALNSAANLAISANQDVVLTGVTSVGASGTVNAGHDVALGGNSSFTGDVSASAANDIDVPGTLQGNNVTLAAGNSASLANVAANGMLAVSANGNAGGGNIAVAGSVTAHDGAGLNAAGAVSVAAAAALGTAGALNVTSQTGTSIAGTLQSNGNMTLTTGASLGSTGTIESGTDLTINAARSIDLGTGSTSALGNLTLGAGQDITANGTVVGQGNGTLNAGGTIGGAASLAFGLAASLSSGADTDLTGSLRGATIKTAAGGSGTFGDLQAGSTIALAANNDLALSGTLAGGSGVALAAGRNIDISGLLQSAGDTSLAAQAGNVGVSGTVASGGALNVFAGSDIDLGGTTTVALDTTLQAARDTNVTGALNGQGNGFISAARNIGGAGSLAFTQAAILSAGGNIAQGGLVQGQTVQGSAAGDAALNSVESASGMSLAAGTAGAGNLTINGSAAAAGSVSATANGDVNVAATGKLAAGNTIDVTARQNIGVAGAIEANGDAALIAQLGSLNASGGINSGGNLGIATGLDLSLGSSTSAVGDVTLAAGRDAVLNGTLVGTNGTVSAGQDITGPGTQAFTAGAAYSAQGDIALTGTLQANSVLATGANNAALNNVISATTIELTANGALGDGDAAITGTATAPSAVTLNAARDVLVSGALGSGTTLTLAAQRNVQVTGGVQSVADLDVSALSGSATLAGTATTSGALNVTTGLDATIGGQTASAGAVNVQAGRDIALTGTLAGQADGTFAAGHDMTGAGSAAFAGAAVVDAAHDLSLTGALQGANVHATAANSAGLGTVQAVTGNIDVSASGNAGGGDVTFSGAVTALGNVTLQAARDVGIAGALNAGGTTGITAARSIAAADINSVGDLTLTATGGNLGAANVATQGNLNASAGQSIGFTGQTQAGANATLSASSDLTLAGGVAAQDTGTLSAGGSIRAGSIAFGQQATLNAGNDIAVSGNLATNGDLAAHAGNSLSAGSATAGGTIILTASGQGGGGDIIVTNGVTSGTATTLTAARDVQVGGAVSSGTTLDVTAARNVGMNGAVAANGNVALKATTGNLSVGGAISTGGNLNAGAGGNAALLAGALVNGDTTVSTGGNMTLGGGLLGLGAGTFNAGGSITGGGALSFVNDIGVNAGGSIALGAVQTAGAFTAASNTDMAFGAATAVGNVNATSRGGSVAFSGAVQSGGNISVQAANSVTLSGGVASVGTVSVTGTQGTVSVNGISSNGDATLTAGQTLTLSGTSVVAGQLGLAGGNVILTGSASGTRNINVAAQGTVDASQATLIASQNLQLNGANVTLGNALVGGSLNAAATEQLTLAGGTVDVVGSTTLVSQGGFYNAASVLSGGDLAVSGQNVTNAANASLASVGTVTVNAANFTNAGLVNGTTTTINVGGLLNNSGGSLMGLNTLNVTTGSLYNQGGLIFAGNPQTSGTAGTGNLSLTINGGDGSFSNASGNVLAQGNIAVNALNMGFDPSQGTISQGGQLSITASTIEVDNNWNYSGTGVSLYGINGIVNNGTMSGTALLTLTTNGTITNNGQVSGNDVTINGALSNAANALLHASEVLTLNGNVMNRGTIEAGSAINVTGGNYDNAGATTQALGDITFNLGGTLNNVGGSIFAGSNIGINAAGVVNDQAAPTGTLSSTTVVIDPALLWSAVAGTQMVSGVCSCGSEGALMSYSNTSTATLGDLLSPTGVQNTGSSASYTNASAPVAGSGTVVFNEYNVVVGASSAGDEIVQGYENLWYVGTAVDPHALGSVTLALPTIYSTSSIQKPGQSGVISAGGSISLTAGSLSNLGGQISAGGNIALNIQSLSNGAVAPPRLSETTETIDQAQYTAFFNQLKALGTIAVANTDCGSAYGSCYGAYSVLPSEFSISPGPAPTATGYTTDSLPTGLIAAGANLTFSGGSLVNAGQLYAGNDVIVDAASLTNQGGNQQNYSSQVGCASGVPNSACNNGGSPRGNNPTTTTFGYSQNDATIYAGHDLVIAAGEVDNTYGNLLAGHNIVIGGVGTTATSTTPAQSLNNTSGNIVAGNDITLNVSGAITNTLPPPVPVHENYGSKEQYAGCMTAGGYKESYCEAYVDQQSGSSSVISAGNGLQINAGSLTNIGSLISAGASATINVAGPVVNEAQTLNAYWHSEWVQETGMFSSDKRHNIWACGSAAECTALYGNAYTSVGGTIDPPTPVGNIAATIEAPNLSISSGGQIQNVGNVVGTYVSLAGQKLINGITTANTYTPTVNAPSQVISLSPQTMPGLNLSTPRTVGTPLPTPVAGTASYVDGSLGGQSTLLGPQQLIGALPSSLQPSSTLFYYNPQEEDLLLQQAALEQTGRASFVSGLSYDSTNNLSVTEQEKAVLYQNALTWAQQNDVQLGTSLTQTQINALTQPMLWYVEQTVPDPSCTASGSATCPTITALMPQVYLPQDTSALSAGGNIEATNSLTLDFGSAATGGSITNTGNIVSGGTLTVNTGTLTNEANQVNVGQIWNSVKGGYTDTTGTVVQPGGFMSAADMQLNVQTLNQIGGALQQLNADGTVDQAGTQQLLTQLQQQLGGDFTQQTVSNNLNTSFTAAGGGFGLTQLIAIVAAVVATVLTYGAASAAVGAAAGATDAASSAAIGAAAEGSVGMSAAAAEAGGTMMAATAGASAGLGNIVISAGIAGMAGSLTSQVIATGSVNWGAVGEAGLVSALTAGLTNGITYNGTNGFGFTTGATTAADPSLASLGGVQSLGNGLVPQAGASTTSNLGVQLMAAGADATISAGVQTVINGGSFLTALENSATSDAAAVGAYDIGNAFNSGSPALGTASATNPLYILSHAALGCAASAAEGTGCAGGAIGGATSAVVSPYLVDQAGGAANLTDEQRAAIVGVATLLGGLSSGFAGQNAQGGATAAENEALNNSTADHRTEEQKAEDAIKQQMSKERAMMDNGGTVIEGYDAEGNPITVQQPPVPALGGATNKTSLSDVLLPNGEPVGYVYPGAGPGIRTVTPEQFGQLQSQLMNGATPTTTPPGYAGTWYQMPDGSVFGIRASTGSGTTIDVIKSNDPSLPSGFKVHQK